jgi:hypothetical protein
LPELDVNTDNLPYPSHLEQLPEISDGNRDDADGEGESNDFDYDDVVKASENDEDYL